MKRLLIAVLATASVFAAASPAAAQEHGLYGGLSYTAYDALDLDFGLATGRVGYQFSPEVAAELEFGVGLGDKSPELFPDASYSIEERIGVYGVFSWPVSDALVVFGRAGYAEETVTFQVPSIRINEERSSGSFAGGIGAELMLDSNNGIRADYLYTPDFEGNGSFSIGYVLRF